MVSETTVQKAVAYAAIVFGVLTQALQGIHLPPVASGILGVFGILLHPGTSVNALAQSVTKSSAAVPVKDAVETVVKGL